METDITRKQFLFLSDLLKSSVYTYSPTQKLLTLTDKQFADLTEKSKHLNITFENTGEGPSIALYNLPFFYDQQEYMQNFEISHSSRDFGILKFENSGIYFNSTSQIFFDNIDNEYPNNEVINNLYYLNIREILCNTQRADFSFANYFDGAHRIVVFISATLGTMSIGYPAINPGIDAHIDLKKLCNRLEISLTAKGYVGLFKAEVFNQLKSIKEEDRFLYLVQNLNLILDNSDHNFDVFLSNFSFDKLRDSLRLEKAKYFNLTKDILSKIYSQITAIPIAISASVFATYKVDNSLVLFIILLAFIIYGFFVVRLLGVLSIEVGSLENDFNTDKTKIESESKLDMQTIKQEIDLIASRFVMMRGIIKYFRFAFYVLTILFIIFILMQIFISPGILENINDLTLKINFYYFFKIQ
ncbi:MAG: hypothetical protein KG003_15045 [Bacteroidetes bacterium]|nr:hypothetical protein [Bacteroidota bacterium]